MSVARAREVIARLRAAGITVHEWEGWESRGNGLTSQYEGFLLHHTGGGFGFAPSLLVNGRPDLRGPLCNTAGNEDGSVTMIAAHPANHAGAGVGPSLGPLPRTNLFNPRVWGHEVVYPGVVPMRDAQYRTSQILARICVDVFGYADPERARLHAETNGATPGGDWKWDAGWAEGKTYDAAAFRRSLATISEDDVVTQQDKIDIANLVTEYVFGRPTSQLQFAGGAVPVNFQGAVNYMDYRAQSNNAAVAVIGKQLDAQAAVLRQLAEQDDRINLDPADMAALTAGVRAELDEIAAAHERVLTEFVEQFEARIDEIADELDGRPAADIRAGLRDFLLPSMDAAADATT